MRWLWLRVQMRRIKHSFCTITFLTVQTVTEYNRIRENCQLKMSSLQLNITELNQALSRTDKHMTKLVKKLIAQMSNEETSLFSNMPALESIDKILTMLKCTYRSKTAKSLDIFAQRRSCCFRSTQTSLSKKVFD